MKASMGLMVYEEASTVEVPVALESVIHCYVLALVGDYHSQMGRPS